MATPKSDLDRVIKKLFLLLRHEQSAREIGSVNEAEAFAAKINDMLETYSLTLDQIEEAGGRDSDDAGPVGFSTWSRQRMDAHQKLLWIAIAEAFGCHVVEIPRYGMVVAGTQRDRAIAFTLFDMLEETKARLARKYAGDLIFATRGQRQHASNSFKLGFSVAIAHRLAPQEEGLVLSRRKQQATDLISEELGETETTTLAAPKVIGIAYEEGQRHGKTASIRTDTLGHGKQQKELGGSE